MRSTTFKFLFLSAIIFAATISAEAQECGKSVDSDIVNSFYAKLQKNSSLSTQINQVNATSVNQALKIRGWVNGSKDYQKVIDYALETKCVRVVNVNDFESSEPEGLKSGGCVGGTKPCGDICIPENEICNIKGRVGFLRTFESSFYENVAFAGVFKE